MIVKRPTHEFRQISTWKIWFWPTKDFSFKKKAKIGEIIIPSGICHKNLAIWIFVSLKSGELGPMFPQKVLCIGQNHIFQLEIWRNLLTALHKQGVCQSHCGHAIYIKKYLKAKRRRIMETQIYFTMQKYINLQKKSSKRNQNPSRYYNITL